MDANATARLDDLERRVDELESLLVTGDRPSPEPTLVPDLRQLEELRHREGPRYVRGGLRGVIAYAGSATLGDGEVLWAGEHGLPQIWDLDPAATARLLAALGHPARLALVRALLAGVRTSQELQEVIGSGSAGQLYHHLKDLMAAGVVDQAGRSRYRIASARIVPLLVILAAAGDVARPDGSDARTAAEHDEV